MVGKGTVEPTNDEEISKEDGGFVALAERTFSARYSDGLSPPADVSYWRFQSLMPMNKRRFGPWYNGYEETITWFIDSYAYVVNARPDKNFERNGGQVYVVLVHRIIAETKSSLYESPSEAQFKVSLAPTEGSALKQLPSSGGARIPTVSGAMFTSGGMEPFTFKATYEDSVDIHEAQQVAFLENPTTVVWGVRPRYRMRESWGTTALSVFRLKNLGLATFTCTAAIRHREIYSDDPIASEDEKVTVNCLFDA